MHKKSVLLHIYSYIKVIRIFVNTKLSIKNSAISVIQQEANALHRMAEQVNDDFIETIESILKLKGRVVITGIGKSAIVAQKIVATLNSTGTPSIFMHAADAIHGDLGMIQQDDLVIVISKSGNTPEIKVLVPLLRQAKDNKIVAIVGNVDSFLAKSADYILDTTVDREACPFNLAPTTSTTAQMAMGDALAVCLIQERQFTAQDFARYHPGGALGKQLYLTVGELSDDNGKPSVNVNAVIRDVIVAITQHRLGAVAVIDGKQIVGIITDGDIRRMLERDASVDQLQAKDIMGKNPKTIDRSELAIQAFDVMRENNIGQLLVTDNEQYAGIVHIQDLLREGII